MKKIFVLYGSRLRYELDGKCTEEDYERAA